MPPIAANYTMTTPIYVIDELLVNTAIFRGIKNNDSQAVLQGIQQGDDVNLICPKSGMTYLHVIMREAAPLTEVKYVPMIYQLSNAGANLDATDLNDDSPLQLSIKGSLLELMMSLIKCGALCNPEKDEEIIDKYTRLSQCEFKSWYRKFAPGYWDAVENNKAFKVNILVKSWCRINVTRHDRSLVEYAKDVNAEEKIIKMLINNEESIELAHATIAGDEERVRMLLLHYNVDKDTKDWCHKESFFDPYCPLSLYGAAIRYGHKHIIPILKSTPEKEKKIESIEVKSSSVCVLL